VLVLLATPGQTLPEDAEQPLDIEADAGVYDTGSEGVSELTGDVRLQQGTLLVTADRMTASNRDEKLHRVVAEGSPDEPARFRQQINPGEAFVEAHADTIVYAIDEQRIEFKGDAFVAKGERKYWGGVLVWYLEENRVDCRAGCRFLIPPPAKADDETR